MDHVDDADKTKAELLAEVQALRDRLSTSEETLRAIRSGEVDALVISTSSGPRIFTLQTADESYRQLVEDMQQGAAILSTEGFILYGNQRLATLLQRPLEQLVGASLQQFLSRHDALLFQAQIRSTALGQRYAMEILLTPPQGAEIPIYMSISSLKVDDTWMACVVITDLTQQKRHEETLAAERLTRLMLEQAGEAILVCDPQGTIIRASQVACELWGQTLFSQSFDALGIGAIAPPPVASQDRLAESLDPAGAKVPFAIAPILRGESIQGLEVELDDCRGQHLSLILSARPLADVDSQALGAVVVLTNISDRARLEAERKRAELAIREQEEILRLFIKYVPSGVAMFDRQMRYLMASQRWIDDYGLDSAESLVGRSHYDLFPEISARWRQIHQRCLAGATEKCEADSFERLDGSIQWLRWEIRPWYQANQTIGGIVIFAEDITDRQHIETQRQQALAEIEQAKAELERRVAERTAELRRLNDDLQQSESTLRSFFDSAPMPMGIVELHNSDILHLSDNGAAAKFFGSTPQAIQNRFASDLGVSPSTLERWNAYYREAERTGAPVRFEYHQNKREGERWLSGSVCPITASPSGRSRFSYILEDITDRKQAEQIQEFQAVITRNMAEGICVVRADNGIIAYANRKFEQMFGYDPGELDGQHVSIVNYATEAVSAEAVNQAICQAVLDHQEATYEVHNVKKDGTPFWCSAATSVFEHPEYGTVLVAVQQDISDRKESQAKLQASLKEKELLLKEIYHRVKNNLQVIYSLLNLQARNVPDPAALAVLRDSQSRVRAMALVHEKLYQSKDLARIDLADYIHSLAYGLLDTYRAINNPVSLRLAIEPCDLDIETALPCGLMLTELISNSLKYAFADGRAGEIAIAATLDPHHRVVLTIQDNGVGLPHDLNLQRVSSLGLRLVQNLARQIKGDVAILPQPVGTAFQITFPA